MHSPKHDVATFAAAGSITATQRVDAFAAVHRHVAIKTCALCQTDGDGAAVATVVAVTTTHAQRAQNNSGAWRKNLDVTTISAARGLGTTSTITALATIGKH